MGIFDRNLVSKYKLFDCIQFRSFNWSVARLGLIGLDFHRWIANPVSAIDLQVITELKAMGNSKSSKEVWSTVFSVLFFVVRKSNGGSGTDSLSQEEIRNNNRRNRALQTEILEEEVAKRRLVASDIIREKKMKTLKQN
ncbi:hypothetical protein Ancab_019471 [Ancistrocladus abbreviatus]